MMNSRALKGVASRAPQVVLRFAHDVFVPRLPAEIPVRDTTLEHVFEAHELMLERGGQGELASLAGADLTGAWLKDRDVAGRALVRRPRPWAQPSAIRGFDLTGNDKTRAEGQLARVES